MLTIFHSPHSRATRTLALLHEMDIRDKVRVRHVTIPRRDGGGAADPENPHPEKKVPVLVDGDAVITETAAIFVYLTDMFPEAKFGPSVNDGGRGPYLMWCAYYAGVIEPVYNILAAGQANNPLLQATFRGVPEVEARLSSAFADGRPFLLGDRMSAADLLVQSPYMWFPDGAPDNDNVKAWIDRVAARPSQAWAAEIEATILPS